jgi:hypothetical protein
MCSKWSSRFIVCSAAAWLTLAAQDVPLDQSSIKINLPADSPLTLISANMGESRAVGRGSAVELDLRMSVTLRNASGDTIRGVTLLVKAQEVTPGGRASVTLPALNVAPEQTFTMPVSMQLLRPGRNTSGPLVEVDLDGVLFQNLSFYGKNRLDSRRALTAYQVEAERDRQYFKQILASYGKEGLQRDVLASMARQAERPRLNVAISRGRAVSAAVASGEKLAQFAFLKFPDSPVEPLEGSAQISGNEARSPNIEIRNKSGRPVRYVEIGWIVKDATGKEFMAASVPASGPAELYLPAGHTARVLQNSSLRFTNKTGGPVAISGMTGFVSQVEYMDGKIWVPDRKSLQNLQLLRVLALSTEEQRLTELYKTKGLQALIEELNKF